MAPRICALPPATDVVVRANPAAATADFATLEAELARLLPRVLSVRRSGVQG